MEKESEIERNSVSVYVLERERERFKIGDTYRGAERRLLSLDKMINTL